MIIKVKVRLTGGPLDGKIRDMRLNERTGLPGPMGCITDAHAKGMHGSYQVNRAVTTVPYELVWQDTPRGDARPCHCGCGGRVGKSSTVIPCNPKKVLV